jgi:hypothetical protein
MIPKDASIPKRLLHHVQGSANRAYYHEAVPKTDTPHQERGNAPACLLPEGLT